jgi:hypothetical protein
MRMPPPAARMTVSIGASLHRPDPCAGQSIASLLGARQWPNTPPRRAEEPFSKIVVVNLWTSITMPDLGKR